MAGAPPCSQDREGRSGGRALILVGWYGNRKW